MALARTRPNRNWQLENTLFDEFDRLFERAGAPWNGREVGDLTYAYPVDLFETDDALVLEMAVPGVRRDDIDVSVEGRQLTLRARVPELDDQNRRYWMQGIPRGEIGRNVKLPASVNVDDIHARVQDGLLTLTMPKSAEAQVRKIAIEEGS